MCWYSGRVRAAIKATSCIPESPEDADKCASVGSVCQVKDLYQHAHWKDSNKR